MIVPTYNEAHRIGATLEVLCRYLAEHHAVWSIVVSDDASADDTRAVVTSWTSREPRIRLLEAPCHQGKGAAVRRGMLAAEADLVCFCDADLSTDLEALGRLVEVLRAGADVVIGSRTNASSTIAVRQHPGRELMGKIFNAIVRALFHLPYRDTQCGFKGCRREAARAMFSRARLDGFAFDVELLILAQRLDLCVREIPVSWNNAWPSRVRVIAHPLQMLGELLNLRRRMERTGYSVAGVEPSEPVGAPVEGS